MDGNNDVTLRCVQGPFPDFEVLFFFLFFLQKDLILHWPVFFGLVLNTTGNS